MKVQKYDVQCQRCCGTFHETTEKFDPLVAANGTMFKLKQQYRDAGWSSFPQYPDTQYENIVCPSCGAGYLDNKGIALRLNPTKEFFNVPDVHKEAGDDTPAENVVVDEEEEEPVAVEEQNPQVDENTETQIPFDADGDGIPDPVFGDDGKAQCPYCDKRLVKSWYTRHIKEHHPEKIDG